VSFWDFLERENNEINMGSLIRPRDDIRILEKHPWSYRNFVGFVE